VFIGAAMSVPVLVSLALAVYHIFHSFVTFGIYNERPISEYGVSKRLGKCYVTKVFFTL